MSTPRRPPAPVTPSEVGWFHFLWPLIPSVGMLFLAYRSLDEGRPGDALVGALLSVASAAYWVWAARRGAGLVDEDYDRDRDRDRDR